MLKTDMKTFIPTNNQSFYFSTCEGCEAQCCNGKKGTLFSQIILDDFKNIYQNFPILFIKGELGYLKPVVLLTNGKNHCQYVKDFKCSIYEKRPSICRVYPLSANIDDNFYIDENCPAVKKSSNGDTLIIKDKNINENFYYDTLNNYKDKYINTHFEFDTFNDENNLEIAINIKNINFYKFKNNFENSYIKIHLQSLEHLNNSYYQA